MANVIKTVNGADLLQEDLPNTNFIATYQGGLEWVPNSNSGYMEDGLAYHTFYPNESNITWIKGQAKWTYNNASTTPITDFYALIGLYGILPDGSEQLIGERYHTPLTASYGVPVQMTTYFDLKASGGNPPVYKDTGTYTAGKICLNLPWLARNIESVNLYKSWMEPSYTGRNRHDLINITSTPIYNGVVGPLWIETSPTAGDNLQRDISIADSDGITALCFWRDPTTTTTPGQEAGHAGHSAYYVLVPYVPGWTSGKVLYSYYGNQGSTPTDYSDGYNVFKDVANPPNVCFDDWEDGLVTGRTAPHRNWTIGSGTVGVDSVSPISGTYSLKVAGDGTSNQTIGASIYTYVYNYVCEFDFMLFSQGTGTYSPYVCLWYLNWKDSSNFVRLDTYYEIGTSTQWLRILKLQAGAPTEVAKVSIGGKLPVGYKGHIKIFDNGQTTTQVWLNNKFAFGGTYSYNWTSTFIRGFGAIHDTIATFDNWHLTQNKYMVTSNNWDYPAEFWYNQSDYGPWLEDNFDDNSIDTNKWVAVLGSGASTPAETGSELRVSGTGTHRAHLRTKRKVRMPWAATFRAKKSENIEFNFDWDWGGIQSGYTDLPDTGYTFRYASWQVPTRFELIKNETGVFTALATTNYTLDTNYHTYRIQRTDRAINVYIDGVWLMAGYSNYCIGGYQGFSARETPAAVNAYYDDYKVGGFLSGKDTYVAITPNTIYSPFQTYVEFATPTGWLEGGPYHFRVKEVQSGEYKTGEINLSARNYARLGYDNIDKYVALRFKIELKGNTTTDFTLNSLEYQYNVE